MSKIVAAIREGSNSKKSADRRPRSLAACTPEEAVEEAWQDEARALEPPWPVSRPWAEVEASFAATKGKLQEAMAEAKATTEEVRRARADPTANTAAKEAGLEPRLLDMEGAIGGAYHARTVE